jgi:hypothetical protein
LSSCRADVSPIESLLHRCSEESLRRKFEAKYEALVRDAGAKQAFNMNRLTAPIIAGDTAMHKEGDTYNSQQAGAAVPGVTHPD